MAVRAEERVEIRAPAGRKAKWVRAAERAGVSLSDWARRRLDERADEELADDEPSVPSPEAIREALKVAGTFKGTGLRERVHAARQTPWTLDDDSSLRTRTSSSTTSTKRAPTSR
jgi:hypothetical protein